MRLAYVWDDIEGWMQRAYRVDEKAQALDVDLLKLDAVASFGAMLGRYYYRSKLLP